MHAGSWLQRGVRTGTALGLLVACSAELPEPGAGANVILVVVDTLRADCLSPYGGDGRTSPNLAALARESVVFEDCRAPAPWTLPSVASLLTGLYPRSHGSGLRGLERSLWGESRPEEYGAISEVPPRGRNPLSLSKRVETLADLLRRRGYATYLRATNPLFVGIDERFETRELARKPAAEVVDWALATLSARDDQRPFLLVLHFIDPHTSHDGFAGMEEDLAALLEPGETPPADSQRSWAHYEDDPASFRAALAPRRRAYEVCARYVDRQIGRLLARLDQLALGPTYLVFTSDHGEDFRDHWDVDRASAHTDPRRQWQDVLGFGHGHNLHRALTHVPLLISGPGIRAARVAQTVSLVDVVPTLCELTGTAVPARAQGRSLAELLAGRSLPPRACLSESLAYGREKSAYYSTDGWLLVLPESPDERPQLFDLAADPHEDHDLFAQERAKFDQLVAEYRSFVAGLRPPERASEVLPDSELDQQRRRDLQALGYVSGAEGEGD